MKTSDESNEQRNVFDVGPDVAKSPLHHALHGKNVLNLRPKLRVRHPWLLIGGILIFVGILIFGIHQLFIKADVQDFYPTTCLGSWQNVANAEGVPETLSVPGTAFTDANSAVYASGTEIYCGGFVPPSFATSGQITNVGLTLVWQIGDAPSSTSVMTVTSTASTTTTSTIISTPDNSTSSPSDVGAPSSTNSDSNVDTDTSTDDSSSTPVDESSDDASSSTPVVPSTTPDTTPDSDPSSTSFIRQLIPFAFADDESSGTVSTTDAAAASTSINASDTADASDTNAIATVALPSPPPDDNFLDVSYSTDGQTWISVGEVNMNNWQQFTVTLPITDWNDLQNLQIRVEGIPTTQDPVPPIYLDGMLMEVHYDSSALAPADDTATSTITGASSTPQRITLVDPGAEQVCDVEPFSQELPLGGTASFVVNLQPSINGVSYELSLGHLPAGISAGFSNPSGPVAASSSLVFQAETSTIPGSMNIQVIYKENEEDGTSLLNYCQLNIDVK